MQKTGLTDVILHALLKKNVPATREVLGSLPTVFSALCLNTAGLNAFIESKPFDKFRQGKGGLLGSTCLHLQYSLRW